MNNLNVPISSNNSSLFGKCQESLELLGERFRRLRVSRPAIASSDFVDHLFGELTHFSYVVELGNKASRERKRS